jgi:hypothetical protein
VTGLLSGAAIIPDSIAGLAQGVIQTMLMQSLKLAGIAVLLAAGALGTVVVAQQGKNGGGNAGVQTAASPTAKAQDKPDPPTAQIDVRVLAQIEELYRADKKARELELLKKTEAVERQLDLLIDVEFPKGIRLDDLLKYIKQQTTRAKPPGIPIYVSPLGLQEAQQKLEFIVTVNTKQTPVRAILEQALSCAGLSFEARDGFLKIDSRTGILESRVEDIDRKLNRVLEALDRLQKAK